MFGYIIAAIVVIGLGYIVYDKIKNPTKKNSNGIDY